ncbi:MAG: M48 family metallopeptidase [Gemmatimonadaceae bacterium]|nr:M48 family metallopeptidase [Gemmatimonadaceae bacterium]MCW5827475.1 M48 family metallopeptidase [Gemmatimonadaceae bacterium]
MTTPLTLNLFEQQAANRRKSWWLVVSFLAFFLWLGLGGDLALWLYTRDLAAAGEQVIYQHRFPWGGLVLGLAAFFLTLDILRNGGKRVVKQIGAEPLTTPRTDQERQLINVVEEMSIAAGLPRPNIYIVQDEDPNAFVSGTKPGEAHLAVTSGLLRELNRDELQAVVAHEMGHVKNEDTRLMTLIAGLGGAILLIRDAMIRTTFRSGGGSSRRGNGKGGNPLAVVVLVLWVLSWILAPIIVRLMAMAVSRGREYLADAMAAQFTRNPAALADALAKIEAHHAPTKSISQGVAHLCIVDPIGRAANEKQGRLADLFATHPPMAIRVSRLRAMAFQAASRRDAAV